MAPAFDDPTETATAIPLGDDVIAVCTCGASVHGDFGKSVPDLTLPEPGEDTSPADAFITAAVEAKLAAAADMLTKLVAAKHEFGLDISLVEAVRAVAPAWAERLADHSDALRTMVEPVDVAPQAARGETQFFLVDVSGDQEVIAEITPGAEIDASLLEGRTVTLVATTGEEAESIRMRFIETENGQRISRDDALESFEPYALFGDQNGDFIDGVEIDEGSYEIKFRAFSEDNAGGDRVDQGKIAFTVVDNGGTEPDDPLADGPITAYTSGGAAETSFNIDLTFEGDGWTVDIQREFIETMDLLSELIIGDIPDVFSSGELIDDVAISATLDAIDGGGNVLAFAGPTSIRTGADPLSATGTMTFDTADTASQLSRGTFDDVVFHEALHVLGFGTLFSIAGLFDASTNTYTGAFGTAMYNDEFGNSANGIPMQAGGGHLDEGTFGIEIMTPALGSESYLSNTTLAILEDLGYDTVLDNPFDPNDASGTVPTSDIFSQSLLA